MDDLIAFLRARLDDDEADTKRYEAYPWWGGSRALRERVAKRAILDLAQIEVQDGRQVDLDVHDALETCIRHLAAVYSSHPDYRAEWKP